jgi:UDP-glucose:tetrahydrobiopterin glucosyltransferase
MGDVAHVMREAIEAVASSHPQSLAFHTHRQAADFQLPGTARVVGNGFDLSRYALQSSSDGPLGWAGRIAPEKGLEDAARAAAALGESLLVWGLREDPAYAAAVEAMVPPGTIQWRGFLPTHTLQQQLGSCRALINTPKWNEAYGNVVVEALACGVPVVAYDRGGPGELIISGETGWLVPPDDVQSLVTALRHVNQIDRLKCRDWAEQNATCEVFSARVEGWIRDGLKADVSIS